MSFIISPCSNNPKGEYSLFYLLEKYKDPCYIGYGNVYQLIGKCEWSITTYKIPLELWNFITQVLPLSYLWP